MEIKGKKVLFLGDSITQGVGASSIENRYPDVFARNTGAIAINYGVSGSRIARQKKRYFAPENIAPERDFILRTDEDMKPDNVDLIVVFGGTNDYGHGDAPMGNMTDSPPSLPYG